MSTRCYDTDLNDAAWAWIAPYLPAARPGGRSRTTDLRAVLNAIFYLLRTGCQWRLLPREFPRPGTVYHYFRAWKDAGVLAELQRALHEQARLSRGRLPCPSVVILDSQSVKTTERGGWSSAKLRTFFSATPFPFLGGRFAQRVRSPGA